MEFFRRKPKKDLNITPEQMMESYSRGKERGIIPLKIDFLASIFSVARRKKGLTTEELSKVTGVNEADLIDLESRQLNPAEAVMVTEKLKEHLEIDEEHYRNAVLKSTGR